jgi:hypothetical protein
MRTIVLLLAAALGCLAQSPSGWMTMGKGGAVQAKDSGMVFAYDVQPKQMAVAVLPAPPQLAHMQHLRFRVKASADLPLAVVLSERKPGGGNYTALLWAPANSWQQVELTPADFSTGDGPNDPVDADGKLDLDQVEGIGILDVAQLFLAKAGNPDAPFAINRATGSRTIEIADLDVIAGDGTAPSRSIDGFDRGFLEWITMGGVKLQTAPKANPLGGPAMQMVASGEDGKFGLAIRRVTNLNLAQAQRMVFDVASENDTTLVISLEVKGGKRFNQTVYPAGKREILHVRVKLADFEGDGVFDPAHWKSITIAEASGQPNTLWIARMGVE